jgi:hypothetical protein
MLSWSFAIASHISRLLELTLPAAFQGSRIKQQPVRLKKEKDWSYRELIKLLSRMEICQRTTP